MRRLWMEMMRWWCDRFHGELEHLYTDKVGIIKCWKCQTEWTY